MGAKLYGPIEHRYCAPVAEAMAHDSSFAAFIIGRTGLIGWEENFRCLKNEQTQLRKTAKFWWKNVFCSESNCKCENLRGREVDILAVFERQDGIRLGLHVECKHPKDRFHTGQAQGYRECLVCWTLPGRGPQTIPQYELARSLLICDRDNKHSTHDVSQFDGVLFFDEIAARLSVYHEPV